MIWDNSAAWGSTFAGSLPAAGAGTSFGGLALGAGVAPASSPASVDVDVAVRYNAVFRTEAGAAQSPFGAQFHAPMSGMRGRIRES